MSQQRDRSRILTPEALAQLQQAIRAWELQHEKKCTQERIRELTSEFKEGGLDQGTISKIRKGREGVDAESIRHVFRAFGLQLQETDLVSSAQAMFQVDPNFVGSGRGDRGSEHAGQSGGEGDCHPSQGRSG